MSVVSEETWNELWLQKHLRNVCGMNRCPRRRCLHAEGHNSPATQPVHQPCGRPCVRGGGHGRPHSTGPPGSPRLCLPCHHAGRVISALLFPCRDGVGLDWQELCSLEAFCSCDGSVVTLGGEVGGQAGQALCSWVFRERHTAFFLSAPPVPMLSRRSPVVDEQGRF